MNKIRHSRIFEQLIKDCKFFDCLVAYFYVSWFDAIFKALQNTEKIRILIGIGTSRETYESIKSAQYKLPNFQFSHSKAKKILKP